MTYGFVSSESKKKKTFFISALICSAVMLTSTTNAADEDYPFGNSNLTLSNFAILTSNFIWRGYSVSGNAASIQGMTQLSHSSGVAGGVFFANQNNAFGSKISSLVYLNYSKLISEIKYTGTIGWHNYPDYPTINTMNYTVYAEYGTFKAELSHIPKFYSLNTSSTYLNLTKSFPISKKHFITTGAGYASFSDEAAAVTKAYAHYKLGIMTMTDKGIFEVYWNDSTRKNSSDVKLPDNVVVASMTIPIL